LLFSEARFLRSWEKGEVMEFLETLLFRGRGKKMKNLEKPRKLPAFDCPEEGKSRVS
jgi:hypothetical protein